MSKEAMKLALVVLKTCHGNLFLKDYVEHIDQAIKALKEALAKQSDSVEQSVSVGDPVAYIRKDQLQKAAQSPLLCEVTPEPRQDRIGIYTKPYVPEGRQQRKPLTKQQRIEIIESLEFENSQQELIDAVEAAHDIKEKNI
jgi:hypothetical protein